MSEQDLCYLSATQAIARFKARTLSPLELMTAIVARAESLNPTINAFTTAHFERALEQARKSEAKYARKGARRGRLEGVPVAIKDLHPIKGEVTTYGSRIFADNVDTVSDPSVTRLLGAGAILLARTATPEFGAATICHSPLWGVTRNPWNLDFSPGGSSGGAGAALAAGMTTLADGSDYGGSIRIPASACGIFGYKPPFGRVPRIAPRNLDVYGHQGPMTRTVSDAVLMLNVMSGQHPGDIVSLAKRPMIPERFPGIRGLKVAFSIDLGYFEVDPEVQANTRAAVDGFRDLGCKVEEVAVGWTSASLSAFLTHGVAGFAAVIGKYLPRWRGEMSDYARVVAEDGLEIKAIDLYRANAVQGEMYARLGAIFRKYDLLLCPTLALPSLPATQSPLDLSVEINGKRLAAEIQWALTYPFNMLAQCPVAAVPSGFASSGVPTGLQIVGRPYDDLSVFRAAAAYERVKPWLDHCGNRPAISSLT